ncbi:MAG: hypothetical protein FWC28_08575 [Proteobacteria bacterium]|nr:hypothetical protein [Cystobacterineae bacterium]MCL2258353.1 hypothetical protein [Cystobacterineae bacterium]MCL2315284.1 hypothetical protein [Pseudomonadota bacterium]
MSTYKQKQKELRAPDAFQKAGGEAIPWLVQNQLRLLVGVVLLALGGGVVGLWAYFEQRAALREAEAFSNALAPLMLPLTSPEGQPSPPLAELNAELVETLKAFEAQTEGKTPAARNANLLLAYLHLQEGQAEKALAAAERFLAKAPPDTPLSLAALEAKGYALEQSEQYDLAYVVFGELEASNTQEGSKGKGEYHQARMLLLKGQKEEALVLFEKVAALEVAQSEAVSLARQRIQALFLEKAANSATATQPSASEAGNEAS